LRITLVVSVVGLGPALAAEVWGWPFPAAVWGYLAITAVFQACYYVGLSTGYQSGYFSTVYPIVRALPILMVAVADVVRGDMPTPLAWLGMGLVSIGCLVIPLESLRGFDIGLYRNRTMLWVLVAALGTVGYSVVDNAAAELIEPGPLAAARYGVFEFSFATPVYWLFLKGLGQPTDIPDGWQGWKWPAIGAAGLFGAYWLILWSYQLTPQTSYIVALRQLSIVIGVAVGVFLFHEPARGLRIGAALVIAGGVACIALAG
jgi:drug/metabolite transporter (DMT)-like permease